MLGGPPAGAAPGDLDTRIGPGATIPSHTVSYADNRIGANFSTGHGVMIRELNNHGVGGPFRPSGVSLRTLIVIPAHNEAENLPPVLREIESVCLPLDVVVVDDGSSDATAALAEQAGVKVLRLPFNLGYGAAVQTGLLYAVDCRYDICVLLDGDGQHDPRDVPALVAPVIAGEADLVVGSRFLGQADYQVPFTRKLGMGLFRMLTSLVTRQRITDPTSGFQAIGARLVRFFANDYPHDFPDADTLIRLHLAGFRIGEVAVTIRPRLRGESMHRGTKALYYVYKMLFSIFIVLTLRRRLREDTNHAARH